MTRKSGVTFVTRRRVSQRLLVRGACARCDRDRPPPLDSTGHCPTCGTAPPPPPSPASLVPAVSVAAPSPGRRTGRVLGPVVPPLPSAADPAEPRCNDCVARTAEQARVRMGGVKRSSLKIHCFTSPVSSSRVPVWLLLRRRCILPAAATLPLLWPKWCRRCGPLPTVRFTLDQWV